jgi:hypothetical protein
MAWVAIEVHAQTVPPHPAGHVAHLRPALSQRRLRRRGRRARAHREARRAARGLFVGGNGDWIDIDAPPGFDTSHGLTLEFWMRRENWVNPYAQGSAHAAGRRRGPGARLQGALGVRQLAFVLDLSLPRERLGARAARAYVVPSRRRAPARRASPARALLDRRQRWTHVAVVYDRFLVDRMRLYVDGKQVARGIPWGSAPASR